jgi:hypothetical protein
VVGVVTTGVQLTPSHHPGLALDEIVEPAHDPTVADPATGRRPLSTEEGSCA